MGQFISISVSITRQNIPTDSFLRGCVMMFCQDLQYDDQFSISLKVFQIASSTHVWGTEAWTIDRILLSKRGWSAFLRTRRRDVLVKAQYLP
jgi:hypothetical protein